MDSSLTGDQQNIAYVLFGLSGLAGIVSTLLSGYNALRRKPSIDVTLQDYAKRADLDALDKRVDDLARQLFERQHADSQALSAKLDRLANAMSDWQQGIERQLGRIEGNCQALSTKGAPRHAR